MPTTKPSPIILISPLLAAYLLAGCSFSHPSSLEGRNSNQYDPSETAWTRIPDGQMRIVVSDDSTRLYVLRNGETSGSLSILNAADGSLIARTGVGSGPIAMAVDGSTGYVANYGSDDVTVVDLDLGRAIGTVKVGSRPIRIQTAVNNPYILVSNYGSGTVSVIEKASGRLVKSIPVGLRPADMAFDRDGKVVFVVNRGEGSLSVVSLNSLEVLRSVPVGDFPSGIVISGNGRYLYVTDAHTNTVQQLEAVSLTVTGRISVGREPMQILASSAAPVYFVMNHESNSISVIDGSGEKAVFTIPLTLSPRCMTVTPDGKYLYVSYGEEYGKVTMIEATGNPPWPTRNISPVFR